MWAIIEGTMLSDLKVSQAYIKAAINKDGASVHERCNAVKSDETIIADQSLLVCFRIACKNIPLKSISSMIGAKITVDAKAMVKLLLLFLQL